MNLRSGVSLAVVLTTVLASCAQAQTQSRASFGKEWVRKHPMQIMGLSMTEATFVVEEYQAVNFNTLLAWKPRTGLIEPAKQAGLPHFLHLYGKEGPTDEFKERVKSLQTQFPNCLGIIVNDEPNLKGMPATREVIDWLRKEYPDCIAMSNAYPIGAENKEYAGEEKEGYGYSEYVRDYVKITDSDIIMFDIYPFSDGQGAGVTDLYYLNMNVVREAAMKAGKPYWAFLQAYQTDNRRLPSESDLRMQIFSSLAYGYTGFAYFTYDVVFDRGLLEPGGEPSPLYAPAAKVNLEVARLGKCMRFLTSTQVNYIAGTSATHVPPSLAVWKRDTNKSPIMEISIVNASDQNHGMIGFFRDDAGKKYFMLTNLLQDAGKSAEDCKATFNVKFGKAVQSVWRLNRHTGNAEELKIESPEKGLTIELEGGSGDLFKFENGSFVGLE